EPARRVRQSKCEPSECSIHDEGLSEHPTKKLNQTSVTPSVVLSTRRNPTKRFSSSASLQLLLQEFCIDSFGAHSILPYSYVCLHSSISLTGCVSFTC